MQETYVITDVQASTLPARRRRYLLMMSLRVLAVPGVLLLPVPAVAQAALVLFAAVTQLVAVIAANTPEGASSRNPNLHSSRPQLPG